MREVLARDGTSPLERWIADAPPTVPDDLNARQIVSPWRILGRNRHLLHVAEDARVVKISGRLKRPWPDLAALALSPSTSALLAAAIAGSFLPDLAGILDQPNLRLFDCTTYLEPAPAGSTATAIIASSIMAVKPS